MSNEVTNDHSLELRIHAQLVPILRTYFEPFWRYSPLCKSLQKEMIDQDIKPANYDLPHITNDTELQNFIKTIGEKFIDTNKKHKKIHGQVYTPIEIVDFINQSIKDLVKSEFGKELSDEDVTFEDPFCGTGIFQARLLEKNPDIPIENLKANDIEWYHFYLTKANLETKNYNQTGKYKEIAVSCHDTLGTDPNDV